MFQKNRFIRMISLITQFDNHQYSISQRKSGRKKEGGFLLPLSVIVPNKYLFLFFFVSKMLKVILKSSNILHRTRI